MKKRWNRTSYDSFEFGNSRKEKKTVASSYTAAPYPPKEKRTAVNGLTKS